MLIDAGVEVDSLYTADITRTLPISGTFSDVQRKVYDAVLEAADYALSIVKPGIVFRDVHAAAMEVIAKRTAEWGILPRLGRGVARRDRPAPPPLHGARHQPPPRPRRARLRPGPRRDMYMRRRGAPGMVFTIEPGLYFQTDDVTVPDEYRGIGVRIEDDILITADGAVNLSAAHPAHGRRGRAWVSSALVLARLVPFPCGGPTLLNGGSLAEQTVVRMRAAYLRRLGFAAGRVTRRSSSSLCRARGRAAGLLRRRLTAACVKFGRDRLRRSRLRDGGA